MQAKGYNGTSVKDIVDAAGVPKGSFYNYFDSKETFALEAIEKVAAENFQAMRQLLRTSDKPAKERLAEFFASNIDDCCDKDFRIGCFLGNMCQEMADSSQPIRNKIRHALADTTDMIETTLRQAQKDGDLDAGYDPAALAEFLFNAWQGALMRMKASSCREPLDAFCSHLDTVFRAKIAQQAD